MKVSLNAAWTVPLIMLKLPEHGLGVMHVRATDGVLAAVNSSVCASYLLASDGAS